MTAASISSRTEILDELERRISDEQATLVIVVKPARLKPFNHSHGVAMGDRLLEAMAIRMCEVAGSNRLAGALRSGLFMLLVEPGSARTEVRVRQIVDALNRPILVGDLEHTAGVRVGVAYADSARTDVDQLLIEANAAMRSASDLRRQVVIADDHIRKRANKVAVIERDVEAVLDSGDLAFDYQPVVALDNGIIHGAEALLRWRHPELGDLDPPDVIARIKSQGLTDRFTEWSLDRIAGQWASIVGPESGMHGASVSINLHEEQLASPLFVPMVERVLGRHSLDPESVVLEVVETGPIGIGEAAAKTLRAVADIGCPIVLDDFGTGFNALEYFLEFPVMGLKFDRSLIVSMRSNETARVIVRGVARIADELGVLTVGEGVETEADAVNCREVPLTMGQGWHYGYPLKLDEFVALALESRRGFTPEALHRSVFGER